MKRDSKRIHIFDTTLRDGEQSPGVNLDAREKLEIALKLAQLGVDIIEAGFPVTSPGDALAVKRIAEVVKGPTICALARTVEKDMNAALASLAPAKKKRLHVFLATSEIHRRFKLKKAKSEIVRMAVWAVKYARNRIDEVEFSPEDASRTERDFLYKVVEETIRAGAKVINIPDTVGYTTPYEFRDLIESIYKNVPNINKAVISVHCHNDLGLAVANSLSAVMGGARQVECTVNGIGERAGNAAMEEIVMALDTRPEIFGGFTTGIQKSLIYETSRLVSSLTGMSVQPNKAIVGKNAFRHESGIHQDGVMKKRSTYEIMDPKKLGFGESKIVLGKLSGRHAFQQQLEKMGYKPADAELDGMFGRFKELADKKKEIFEDDIRKIVETAESAADAAPLASLEGMRLWIETGKPPRAEIRIRFYDQSLSATTTGDGPVDAAYKALDEMVKLKLKLIDYSIRSVTTGKDAQGEVLVLVRTPEGAEVRGRGVSTDVIEASVKAYLDAVHKVASKKGRAERQELHP